MINIKFYKLFNEYKMFTKIKLTEIHLIKYNL